MNRLSDIDRLWLWSKTFVKLKPVNNILILIPAYRMSTYRLLASYFDWLTLELCMKLSLSIAATNWSFRREMSPSNTLPMHSFWLIGRYLSVRAALFDSTENKNSSCISSINTCSHWIVLILISHCQTMMLFCCCTVRWTYFCEILFNSI